MPWYARLTWTEGNPTWKGTGFKIYVSINSGAYSLAATVPISTTQYDYAVSPGNTYFFQVAEYKTISGVGDIESPRATLGPVHVPGTPSRASGIALSSSRTMATARVPASATRLVFQRLISGSWQTFATSDNLIHTQGNALHDWAQWSHWNDTAYWETSSQTGETGMGRVFVGKAANAPTNRIVLLYDYYPYSFSSGTTYILGIALRAAPATVAGIAGYLCTSGGQFFEAPMTYARLTEGTWQYFLFPVTPGATASGNGGIGFKIWLPRPHATTIYAAAPFFGIAPAENVTMPLVRRYRVRAENGAYFTDWVESSNLYFWKKVQLTWSQGNTAQPGEAFIIEKRIGTGSWEPYSGVALSTTTWHDTELVENTTMSYRVYEAYGGRLSPAAEASVTVPLNWAPTDNKPQNLTVTIIR